jgi:hypothetical protein
MFTTSRRAADQQRANELGVRRFIVKPSTYPELVDFVRDLAPLASEEHAAATERDNAVDPG